VKLELHVYQCRKCGCGRKNVPPATRRGRWGKVFFRPIAGSLPLRSFGKMDPPTPECERGDLTDHWLQERLAPVLDQMRSEKA
jgi:hypothetical protein